MSIRDLSRLSRGTRPSSLVFGTRRVWLERGMSFCTHYILNLALDVDILFADAMYTAMTSNVHPFTFDHSLPSFVSRAHNQDILGNVIYVFAFVTLHEYTGLANSSWQPRPN